jgi:hypothetical protein
MSDDTQMILFCEGCGQAVVVNLEDGPTSRTREPESGAAPGRVTIAQGVASETVVHQCAPGTYLPPDQKAQPRR